MTALFPETRRAWKRLRRAWLDYRLQQAKWRVLVLESRLYLLDRAQ